MNDNPYRFKPSPWSSHGQILQQMASRPRDIRILEVGTAEGYLGEALRSQGFHHVTSWERDPQWACLARPHYTELAECDLDEPSTWPKTQPFGLILCADVLEHLRDPWETLRQLSRRLAPQGRMILSIPNSGHGWVRLNVLAGRFPMDSRGLFDRTHLHFFTWKTLSALIRHAELRVEWVRITPIPFASVVRNPSLQPLLIGAENLYRCFAFLWKKLFAYQFVLCVYKP